MEGQSCPPAAWWVLWCHPLGSGYWVGDCQGNGGQRMTHWAWGLMKDAEESCLLREKQSDVLFTLKKKKSNMNEHHLLCVITSDWETYLVGGQGSGWGWTENRCRCLIAFHSPLPRRLATSSDPVRKTKSSFIKHTPTITINMLHLMQPLYEEHS